MATFLEGKTIRLRRFHERDLPELRKWLNNPELQWYTDEDFPIQWTDEMILHLYGKAFRGRREMYAIETLDGKLIGEIWLHPMSQEQRYAEMVMAINVPYQGQGYGREAVQMILRHGFNRLELHRIEIKVYSFNERAYHLYQSCGFREEGRLRERILRNGEYYDQIFMAILRQEYLQMRERSKTP